MALNAAGSSRKPAGKWAVSPEELAGTGTKLAQVLELIPTGRLVVLGEPGAGKTVLMIRLVLDLLAEWQLGRSPFCARSHPGIQSPLSCMTGWPEC